MDDIYIILNTIKGLSSVISNGFALEYSIYIFSPRTSERSMDNTQCSSTPLASEVMITAVMLIFWLRAPAFGPFERWDVVDLFAGQARIARLARQYGQSSIAMDIGYHEDPHIFDINSEPGFVYLSLGNRQNYFLFVEFGSLSSSS